MMAFVLFTLFFKFITITITITITSYLIAIDGDMTLSPRACLFVYFPTIYLTLL